MMARDRLFSISDVQQALLLSDFDALEAQMMMTPTSRAVQRPPERTGEARLGGVLALLYFKNDELYVVLTRRRDDLNSHAGQISFPGGRREGEETLLMTALRETEEEIGIASGSLEVLGHLTTLYIPPSDYKVHPYVAWYNNGGQPRFAPSADEVAEIIEVPLRHFFDPAARCEEPWEFQGNLTSVPYYQVENYKIWGATAMMICEFVERLRLVVS